MNESNKGLEIALKRVMFDDPEYWKALGQFIEEFANTELALYALLGHYAGTDDLTSNAVFPGIRASVIMQHIARLLDAKNHPNKIKVELKNIFEQMRDINDARNNMIHYASRIDLDTNERFVTDEFRRVVGEKKFRVSPEILALMREDLKKIGFHCVSILVMPDKSFDERAKAYPFLLNAWKYIHAPNHPQKGQHKKK